MFLPYIVFWRARKEPFQRTGSCFANVSLTLPLRREKSGKAWVSFYDGLSALDVLLLYLVGVFSIAVLVLWFLWRFRVNLRGLVSPSSIVFFLEFSFLLSGIFTGGRHVFIIIIFFILGIWKSYFRITFSVLLDFFKAYLLISRTVLLSTCIFCSTWLYIVLYWSGVLIFNFPLELHVLL